MEPIAPSRRWLAVAGLIAAGAAVFWAFDALPFQDLPAHAGLMALRHRLPHSPFEQRFLVLSPHLGPYSFFRAAGDGLLGPLGPVGAVRALMTLPVVAVPAALGWARHRLHGDGAIAAALTGLCLTFGFMTVLGFASYLLGLAALVVACALWLEAMDLAGRPDQPDPRLLAGDAAIAVAALAVLLLHGYAFAVFVGLAVVVTLAAGVTPKRILRLRALVPALALAAFMLWEDRARDPAAAAPALAPGPHFEGLVDKLGLLCTPTLMTRWGVDLLVGMLLGLVLGAALVVTVRRNVPRGGSVRSAPPRLRGAMGALAALVVAFAALPRSIGWFGFIDGRLVPVILIVAALAVERSAIPRWLWTAWDVGAAVGAATLVAVAWVASYRFQSEATGWRDVVAAIPARSTLLNLPLDPDSDVFTGHPFVHYDKLAVAEKPVVVSDVWFHQGTALYPAPDHPALHLPPEYSESNLQRIDWPSYRLEDWDYVLVRTKPYAALAPVPGTLEPVLHRGGWWLFATRAPHSR
jgi:hypothetical protein